MITLSATDPEGVSPTVWSLPPVNADPDGDGNDGGPLTAADAADNDSFKISDGGALSFKSPPSFEPAGSTLNTNSYKVVVQATDRGDMDHRNWFKVTVNVMDVEEPGR